ncbi:hypothetical protein MPTK1_4g17200 [Marchantia polymorpha subsp. ruderalis]|uniref:Uncharacterized protein n=2 Tax=Marchantia polymorpha TaxID=3197 RepID=A0AAF6BAS3_MARPO|nr:hypothetical protein MARPO_0041s0002 [Marchantia polymorpha]BBN09107.1 hypothetical protein Mp_4g17200 [Marchantia polymorpha subsp. ruderalis]|eukprot:PTQ40095.1 hypothetical protein MARPO_0041s0002 [Marchantia polymorpha]
MPPSNQAEDECREKQEGRVAVKGFMASETPRFCTAAPSLGPSPFPGPHSQPSPPSPLSPLSLPSLANSLLPAWALQNDPAVTLRSFTHRTTQPRPEPLLPAPTPYFSTPFRLRPSNPFPKVFPVGPERRGETPGGFQL